MPTILVVDDEEAVLHLLTNSLRAIGYKAVEAASGAEALQRLDRYAVDLVLADLVMPEMSGLELLHTIKRRWVGLPVVIISGKPSVETAVEAVKAGAADFLRKPVDLDRLRCSLEAALNPERRPLGHESTGTMQRQQIDIVPGYKIRNIIGMGKSSIVYLADWQRESGNQLVALKVLRTANQVHKEDLRETTTRFSREAMVVSSMKHPNIVRLYDFDVAANSDVPYIAMEYVDGSSLRERLSDYSTRPIADKVGLLIQLSRALKAVHTRGLIHRDVKPQNILLGPGEIVKLTDFSLVQVPMSELTNTMTLVGTPAYMAPEAFFSADVDGRADLFSMGVTAYELFFGVRPFRGKEHRELADAIQYSRPVDPLALDQAFPPDLRRILAHLLRKMVDGRYQSADEVLHDLLAFQEGKPLHNPAMDKRDGSNLMDDWSRPPGPVEGRLV